jgi:outer membrane protein, heavy metal efflux system
MSARIVLTVVMGMLVSSVPVAGQAPDPTVPLAARYIDSATGLSLEQAIARALEREPSLRAARAEIDASLGMRQQASLRPNPSVSLERREQSAGPDNQTTVGIQWPLDLFRKEGRVAVADREVAAVRFAATDRERLLAADVRMAYGGLLSTVRDLGLLDELVEATRQQHALLRSRVDEGASPPIERNLLEVELRRLESERVLQAGQADAALFELKRVLGMRPEDPLMLRDNFESLVEREGATSPASGPSSASDQRADVHEAAARVDVAEAKIDRADREGRFDVSVFANYMRMDAGFPQSAFAPDGGLTPIHGLFHYVSAGAMITIPLLNRNQGLVAAAHAERARAAATLEAVRLAAEADLAAARTRDERAREAVRLYGAGAQSLARQNLTVVRQSYQLGRVTVFDVLAELRRYLDVERAYTNALRSAFDARTALNRAMGQLQ